MPVQTVVASGALTFEGGSIATDTLMTFLLGFGIVFIGLVMLVFLVKLMGGIIRAVEKPKKAEPVPAETKEEPEANHGELVAAIAASLATVMGKQVSGIRIHSIKKLD